MGEKISQKSKPLRGDIKIKATKPIPVMAIINHNQSIYKMPKDNKKAIKNIKLLPKVGLIILLILVTSV